MKTLIESDDKLIKLIIISILKEIGLGSYKNVSVVVWLMMDMLESRVIKKIRV
jgi:hypothetical protein